MKKLLTLALLLCVSFLVFAQNGKNNQSKVEYRSNGNNPFQMQNIHGGLSLGLSNESFLVNTIITIGGPSYGFGAYLSNPLFLDGKVSLTTSYTQYYLTYDEKFQSLTQELALTPRFTWDLDYFDPFVSAGVLYKFFKDHDDILLPNDYMGLSIGGGLDFYYYKKYYVSVAYSYKYLFKTDDFSSNNALHCLNLRFNLF